MMDEKKDYFVYTDKMTVGYNGEPLIKEVEEPKTEEPKKERKSKSAEKADEE